MHIRVERMFCKTLLLLWIYLDLRFMKWAGKENIESFEQAGSNIM
jgi:hypothetical protein